MEIFRDFLVALFAAFGLVSAIWYIGCALNPPPGRGARITAVVAARGSAAELTKNVDALQRLRGSGYRNMQIMVINDGMDPAAEELAARLSERGEICLCGLWEILKQ